MILEKAQRARNGKKERLIQDPEVMQLTSLPLMKMRLS